MTKYNKQCATAGCEKLAQASDLFCKSCRTDITNYDAMMAEKKAREVV